MLYLIQLSYMKLYWVSPCIKEKLKYPFVFCILHRILNKSMPGYSWKPVDYQRCLADIPMVTDGKQVSNETILIKCTPWTCNQMILWIIPWKFNWVSNTYWQKEIANVQPDRAQSIPGENEGITTQQEVLHIRQHNNIHTIIKIVICLGSVHEMYILGFALSQYFRPLFMTHKMYSKLITSLFIGCNFDLISFFIYFYRKVCMAMCTNTIELIAKCFLVYNGSRVHLIPNFLIILLKQWASTLCCVNELHKASVILEILTVLVLLARTTGPIPWNSLKYFNALYSCRTAFALRQFRIKS